MPNMYYYFNRKKKNAEKEESISKMAERNSNIWEARLKMAEFQKDHYRYLFILILALFFFFYFCFHPYYIFDHF